MNRIALRALAGGCLFALGALALAGEGWKLALPGWEYEFPRDHGNHQGFKTEWWYFTGNLHDEQGREYGYQLTFFRQGISPDEPIARSRFVARDVKFAHFAVTEITDRRFHFFQELSRGAYGEAGFGDGNRLAWIGEWECELVGGHDFRLRASGEGVELDLLLTSEKAPVFHGGEGVSQKSDGPGRASHYYSLTRLATRGTLGLDGEVRTVAGTSWFDHEWATNQLDAHQTGWDWFSIQFDDGAELMIFQIRTKDGGRDRHSGGSFVAADGTTTPIKNADFRLVPGRVWKSPATNGKYPVEWKLEIPKLDLALDIRAALDGQELNLQPLSYWEGSIRTSGSRRGQALQGRGYLEMTGYGSPIVGMQAR